MQDLDLSQLISADSTLRRLFLSRLQEVRKGKSLSDRVRVRPSVALFLVCLTSSCVRTLTSDPSFCSDIVERFQLSLMLTVIAVRNLIEMSGSDFAFLPKSFIKGKGNVETILSVRLAIANGVLSD